MAKGTPTLLHEYRPTESSHSEDEAEPIVSAVSFDMQTALLRAYQKQEVDSEDLSEHEVDINDSDDHGNRRSMPEQRHRQSSTGFEQKKLSLREMKRRKKARAKRADERNARAKVNGGLTEIAERNRARSMGNAQSVGVAIDTDLLHAGSSWQGPAPKRRKKDESLPTRPVPPNFDDLLTAGYTYVPYDGLFVAYTLIRRHVCSLFFRKARPIIDKNGVLICAMIPPPRETWAPQQAADAMRTNGEKLTNIPTKFQEHRRGDFPAVPMGLSHGGGQPVCLFFRFVFPLLMRSAGARYTQAWL